MREQSMMKQVFGEALIIATATLFFFALTASVGIPGDEERASTAVAAEEVLPSLGGRFPPELRGPLGGGRQR